MTYDRYIFTKERISKVKQKCREFLKASPYAEDIKVMYFRLEPFQFLEETSYSAVLAVYCDDNKVNDREWEFEMNLETALNEAVTEHFNDSISISVCSVHFMKTNPRNKKSRETIKRAHFIKGKTLFFKSVPWCLD